MTKTFYLQIFQILVNLVSLKQKILLMDGFLEGLVIDNNKSDEMTIELFNNGSLRPKAHLTIPGISYPLTISIRKR